MIPRLFSVLFFSWLPVRIAGREIEGDVGCQIRLTVKETERGVEFFDTLTFCDNMLQGMAYIAKSYYDPAALFMPVKNSACSSHYSGDKYRCFSI